MHDVSYLSKEEYTAITKRLQGGHWTPGTVENRWDYHSKTIELIKKFNIKNASDVLEMGTMGVRCVNNSDTIDYTERWGFEGKSPTYVHDARAIPWPIKDKQYEVFVALRVFQHLTPNQKECVKEAMRVAKKVIIVVPPNYNVKKLPESRGITYKNFVQFLDGIHPNHFVQTASGQLYYWDTQIPSKKNLEKTNIVLLVKKLIKRFLKKLKN